MKKPLVTYLWYKLIERDSLSIFALKEKIAESESIWQAIENAEGIEAARNVLCDGLITHALRRCLENLEGSTSVTERDYWCFYKFATFAAEKAEETIDRELSHLNL